MKTAILPLLALLAALTSPARAATLDPAPFLKPDGLLTLKISPDGNHLAATIPLEDRTILVILGTADRKLVSSLSLGRNINVDDFWWVNSERVLASVADKFGSLDEPLPTGELMAVNVDGSRSELLIGQRVVGKALGSRISAKKGDRVAASLIDDLPDDDRNVIISTEPFITDPTRKIERMDVYTGRRVALGLAPVQNATFHTDNRGVVRFATGFGRDRASKLFHRPDNDADWTLIGDQAKSGLVEIPVGFSADDRLAYLQTEREKGPDVLVELDVATGQRRTVLEDDDTDPTTMLYRSGSRTLIGAVFVDGARRVAFLDNKSPEARLQRSLEAAFKGQSVLVTSTTKDGGLALVQTWSDRSPGDFYLFDTKTKHADYLLARRDWLDPAAMGSVRPIALEARDGLALHGYLTLPANGGATNLPLVVMPHGGPFNIFDTSDFDPETQMLTASGYAVLQVNFRGSGNHGRAFHHAGAGEWGRKMQDDVTDATRWAIDQGIADPKRICIHGASYGAYAALMGAAREPSLYRCASGYVGVYDLAAMHKHGDIQSSHSGETYLREWLGEPATLAAVSPTNLAAQIKIPVLLAAGGEDRRAPILHSIRMQKALEQAGVPVETLYFDTEGHGFYDLAHRQEYYTKLLAFLDRHLGATGRADN